MPKDDVIEVEGVVVDALPNANFKVRLQNGHEVLAHISGKLRMHYIKISDWKLPHESVLPHLHRHLSHCSVPFL